MSASRTHRHRERWDERREDAPSTATGPCDAVTSSSRILYTSGRPARRRMCASDSRSDTASGNAPSAPASLLSVGVVFPEAEGDVKYAAAGFLSTRPSCETSVGLVGDGGRSWSWLSVSGPEEDDEERFESEGVEPFSTSASKSFSSAGMARRASVLQLPPEM